MNSRHMLLFNALVNHLQYPALVWFPPIGSVLFL